MKIRGKYLIKAFALLSAAIFSACGASSASKDYAAGEALLETTISTFSQTEPSKTTSQTSQTTTGTTSQTTAKTEAATTAPAPETTTLSQTAAIVTTAAPVTQPTATVAQILQVPALAQTETSQTEISFSVTPQTTTAGQVVAQKLSPLNSTYTYNNLSPELKKVYSKILSAAKSFTTQVTFDSPVSLDDITKIYSAIYMEEINLQYLSNSFKYDTSPATRLQISFDYPQSQISRMNEQTEEAANRIIAGITPTMTAFDIVKYFHDTIIKNCTYDANVEFGSTAYGALVNGRALCQGYSHAMALLCNKVGIENAFVTGYAKEDHMWNMVKLNGVWYNIDVTWDDPDKAAYPDLVFYDYFNVTNSDLSARQIYSGYVPLPDAFATDENYFVKNGFLANSLADAQQILFNQIVSAAASGNRYVRVKCANTQVYNEVYQSLITQNGISSIIRQANSQVQNKFNLSVKLTANSETRVINFILS
ncbi:MAG TPA: transglutaminase domain-containing protein [Oscillospiraceae bacterium]|jgi:transglutaminase/protease-like cytokinesis protein 3|nr:hypothetical protein [Oscillospiraceae bacterium]HOV40675.1 transglutaminase domain-containing protein [Oscillospiraceae bacterium]